MEVKFETEYKKLNAAQRQAVDHIDGPVMVVAGPGTGKTQVLALRIANILNKTDTKGDGILCLTFTNSAVKAMQERLGQYIGEESLKVNVSTYHSFGMKVVEEYFKVLGLAKPPKLLEEIDTAIIFDKILSENDWQYLRPRSDSTRYFKDLRSLISLLSRERITEKKFLAEIEKEIKFLESDEDSISKRGESKGELKKEVEKHINDLLKSKEVVRFIELYEKIKKEENLFDYDDVLENLVRIVEESPDALASIRERYLYVLIDEHQDSSRVQNEFLAKVWQEVEKPNIFVVGDDRQLIYGFSGASIEHFAGFKKTFPGAKLITLVDNYRSTQIILDASHALLQSVMSDAKLLSQHSEHHPIHLVEAFSKDDEIIAATLDIKEKIKKGVKIDDCAILVPKNAEVRKALEIIHQAGLPISSLGALNLFDQEEAVAFLRVLKVVSDPDNTPALAMSFFDKISGVPVEEATDFFLNQNMREFSFASFGVHVPNLFGDISSIEKWIAKLTKWQNDANNNSLEDFIKSTGQELFSGGQAGTIVSGEAILNTFLKLLANKLEKDPDLNLAGFVLYLDRLVFYNELVPIEAEDKEGVKVMTMHSSKGLEFDYVWLAHMDEKSLTGGKRAAFVLPEAIASKVEERDIDAVKRKLYVSITRAKRFCTLSYNTKSTSSKDKELAKVIRDLPEEIFEKIKVKNNAKSKKLKNNNLEKVVSVAKGKYTERYVSASLLNNFFECPWKWYFNNLLQIPKDTLEILEFGSAVHSVLDRILKMKNIPSESEIPKIVSEEVFQREFGDKLVQARMAKEIESIVSTWATKRLPEIRLDRKTEESVSLKDENFPHLKIYGKIDLIENLSGKEVRVTDFKTGSAKKKSEIEKLDDEERLSSLLRQLAMYSYLLEKNPKLQISVRESRLEFLEAKGKDAIYDHVVTGGELDLLVKDIRDYDQMLKDGTWVERECNYNSYGKNNECEYCQLAEIYK